MKEIFKDIKGYEGHYQVSNLGNVRSVERQVTYPSGKKWKYKSKHMKTSFHNGYELLTLSKEGVKSRVSVHRLVATAFLGHEPCGFDVVVDHKDNDSMNNKLNNLQLISQRENCSKDKKSGTSKYTGVSWFSRDSKWRSSISFRGSTVHLGYFKKELDAHYQYELALDLINEIDDLTIEELKSI